MTTSPITVNGQQVTANLPCSIEEFLIAQGLLPRSVGVTFQTNPVKFVP